MPAAAKPHRGEASPAGTRRARADRVGRSGGRRGRGAHLPGALALRERPGATAPRGGGRRHHEGRHRLAAGLRGHARCCGAATTTTPASCCRRWRGAPTAAREAARPARPPATPAEAFHLHRMAQAQRARTLGMLLIPFEAGAQIPLRRAPAVAEVIAEAVAGTPDADLADAPFVMSLRELLGLIGAHEWRRKGVLVPALGERIHPWYGVYSPIRGEYLDLVARVPLPATHAGLRHRHRHRRHRRAARAPRGGARGGHRPVAACAGLRAREPRPPRAAGRGRGPGGRPSRSYARELGRELKRELACP